MLLCLTLASGAAAVTFQITECTSDIDVDGSDSDDAWDDAESKSFSYVDYYMCYDNTNLYALFNIDDNTSTDDDLIAIYIDADDSGDDAPDDDDFGFEVKRDGGIKEYVEGDSVTEEDWSSDVDDNDEDGWVVEMSIELQKLGISRGDDTSMGYMIMVDNENDTGAQTTPSSGDEDDPSTWTNHLEPDSGTWGENTAPTLTLGKVTADGVQMGLAGNYKFEVIYKDADGDAPTLIKVDMAGAQSAMTKETPSCNVVTGCKYVYSKALANGEYTFFFLASDGEDPARFPTSGDLQLSIAKPNQKPVVLISGPASNSEVSGLVQVYGTATDPDGLRDLSAVQIKIDSGQWVPATGTGTWQYTYDSSNVAAGQHIIYAKATDVLGAESDVVSVIVTVKERELPPAPNQDTDGDGMTDVWENRYGLNPKDATDAKYDSDSDGATNLEEFKAGTDPKRSASKPEEPEPIKPPAPTPAKSSGDGFMMWVLASIVIVLALIVIVQWSMGKGKPREGGVNKPKRIPKASELVTAEKPQVIDLTKPSEPPSGGLST